MALAKNCQRCMKYLENPKHCAKCQSVNYCGRDCQKKDWSTHKKDCAILAAARSKDQDVVEDLLTFRDYKGNNKVLSTFINKPFTKLESETWLHGRPDKDVYKLLIDAWRLRKSMELDILNVTEVIDLDPDVSDGLQPFEDYLDTAKAKGLLSPGWDDSQKAACITYGLDKAKWTTLHDLFLIPKKFIEHYGSPRILLQLVYFNWQVLGPIYEDEDETKMEDAVEEQIRLERRHCS